MSWHDLHATCEIHSMQENNKQLLSQTACIAIKCQRYIKTLPEQGDQQQIDAWLFRGPVNAVDILCAVSNAQQDVGKQA